MSSLRVKICGLMTEEDCRIMNRCRPDYAGFVFANTRHKISDETAAKLREHLDPAIPAVGVFVDEDPAHVVRLVADGVIQFVQLHGREDDAYIARLRELIMETVQDRRWRSGQEDDNGNVTIIRAVRLRDGSEIEPADRLACDMLLVDAWDDKLPGGSGKRIRTELLTGGITKPWFLAGGLKPDNVRQVLSLVRETAKRNGMQKPFAVDVSSGVESAAAGGHKDEGLVTAFLSEVRTYEGF